MRALVCESVTLHTFTHECAHLSLQTFTLKQMTLHTFALKHTFMLKEMTLHTFALKHTFIHECAH